MKDKKEIIEIINAWNHPLTFEGEPVVRFREFEDRKDQEIYALISSWLHIGEQSKVNAICEKVLMELMHGKPYRCILQKYYLQYKNNTNCLYLSYTYNDFYDLCQRIDEIYMAFPNLETAIIKQATIECDGYVGAFVSLFSGIKGIPQDTKSTCKRINLLFKWLVRNDNIVDLGVWNKIHPNELLLPCGDKELDAARKKGFLRRKSNDLKAVKELTEYAKGIFADDPCLLYFYIYSCVSKKSVHIPTEKEKSQTVMLYSLYSMLYANDMACNLIKDIEPFIKDRDKETRKIYGALKKRIKEYFSDIEKTLTNSIYFLADYCSAMDEINDCDLYNYRNTIANTYKRYGLSDYKFLGYVECARSMVDYSVLLIDVLCQRAKERKIDAQHLLSYQLLDIKRVVNNFADWCYRKVECDVNLNKDNDCVYYFSEINKNIASVSNFEIAYKYASKNNNN